MGFSKNHRSPVQLTAVARAAVRLVLEQYALTAFLPTKKNNTLSFNFDVNQTALPAAASFRSFNAESDVASTPGTESRQGKLPPISRRLHVDEHTELVLYGMNDAIGETFDAYARRIAQQIGARIVLAVGEGIETGKVTLAERGLSFTVDYGRKASHTATAAGGVWTGPGSTPLADLEAARAVYGRGVATMWTSPEVMAALTKNPDIAAAAFPGSASVPSRVSYDDVRSVLASYGFGNLVISDDAVLDQTGAEKRLVSSDKVLFLPSVGALSLDGGALGSIDFGIPAEAVSPDNGIAIAERSGLFAGALPSNDPEGYDILVSGIVLPVISNANATFSLDVL